MKKILPIFLVMLIGLCTSSLAEWIYSGCQKVTFALTDSNYVTTNNGYNAIRFTAIEWHYTNAVTCTQTLDRVRGGLTNNILTKVMTAASDSAGYGEEVFSHFFKPDDVMIFSDGLDTNIVRYIYLNIEKDS